MKALQSFLVVLCNILLIPVCALLSFFAVWYTLPELVNTLIGEFLLDTLALSNPVLFWICIGTIALFIILIIIKKLFDKHMNVKFKNASIHLNTWLITLIAVALAIFTFIVTNPLEVNAVTITATRKIGIACCIGSLIIFHIFSDKLERIINRKITAYDTAKEINEVGRSSVIFTNILKLVELLFPEIILMALISFCVSWNVASYFIIILCSTIIPMIGNIVCDFNIRFDINKKKEDKK